MWNRSSLTPSFRRRRARHSRDWHRPRRSTSALPSTGGTHEGHLESRQPQCKARGNPPGMRNRPLRVVVVGAGAIGRVHARVACDDPDLEVAGIVASSPDRAERLADDLAATGARRPVVSGALSSILAANDADLVAVCTPSGSHAELAHEAMTAGAHVVIEKPVAASLRCSRQLLSEFEGPRARGQVILVISQHRFDSGASFLHNAIAHGRLGRPTSAIGSVGWWRSQSYYDSGAWRGTWQLDGGGAVMNQAVHTVDLLLWLIG